MKVPSQSAIDWRRVIDEVKDRLDVLDVLKHLGWRVSRNRKRATCGICGGKEDIAIKRDLWHCHKCKRGGTAIDLIMFAHGVKFLDALKYAANLAGVEMPAKMTAEERRRLAEQEAQRKRIGSAADRLEAEQHALRLYYRTVIHNSERLIARISTRLSGLMNGDGDEQAIDSYWSWLALLWELQQEALVAYSIVTFANARTCAQFAMQPAKRDQMIAETRLVGHFFDDDDKWMEVLT